MRDSTNEKDMPDRNWSQWIEFRRHKWSCCKETFEALDEATLIFEETTGAPGLSIDSSSKKLFPHKIR